MEFSVDYGVPAWNLEIDGFPVTVIPQYFETQFGVKADLSLGRNTGLKAYVGGGCNADYCNVAGFNASHPENNMDYAVPADHPFYGKTPAITVYSHPELSGVVTMNDVEHVCRRRILEAIDAWQCDVNSSRVAIR